MGGVRRSKKRKIEGSGIKPTTFTLTWEAREMLDKLAGYDSLSNTVDRMIKYVYRRQQRKSESKQVA